MSTPAATPSVTTTPNPAAPDVTTTPASKMEMPGWLKKPEVQIGIAVAVLLVTLGIVLTVIFVPSKAAGGKDPVCDDLPTDKTSLAWAQCHDSSGTATGTLVCNHTTKAYDCYCGTPTKKGSTDGMTLLTTTCTTKDSGGNTNFTGVPYCTAEKKVECGCGYTSAASFTSKDNTTNGWCPSGGGAYKCTTSTSNVMGTAQCTCGSEVATSNSCSAYPNSKWTCNPSTNTIDCQCGSASLRDNFGAADTHACSTGPCSDPTSPANVPLINNAFDSSAAMTGPNGIKTSCGCDCTCAANTNAWSCRNPTSGQV